MRKLFSKSNNVGCAPDFAQSAYSCNIELVGNLPFRIKCIMLHYVALSVVFNYVQLLCTTILRSTILRYCLDFARYVKSQY